MKSIRVVAAIAAVGCVGAFAPAALAASPTYVSFDVGVEGSSVYADGGNGSSKLDVFRGGDLLSSATGTYGTYLTLPGLQLQAGDTAQYSVDGAVRATVAYDGTPTIGDDACIGRSGFTGTRNPEASVDYVGAFAPNAGAYGQSSFNVGRVTSLSGSSYAASLASPLAAGDVAYVGTERIVEDVNVFSSVARAVGACPAPPAPPAPAPAPAPPTKAQLVAGLKQSLKQASKDLKSVDGAKLAKKGALPVGFTFLTPGKVKFTLMAPALATKSKKHKAKALVIAAGTKVAGKPGHAAVSLKLTAAGRKLLRGSKPVKATLSATFTSASGGPSQKAQTHVNMKRAKKADHRH